ncbi:MAG: hypothetical protein ACW979_02090 [Candidatus Thorarchaeota archaeon]
MTKDTIQSPIDMRALDQCICGHIRKGHEERSRNCTNCGCSLFSKTVYKYSDMVYDSNNIHDAE